MGTWILNFFVNLLSTPAIIVGLLAMLGLILQGKPVEDVISGTLKTICGFLVLNAGSDYLQNGSLLAFGEVFNYAFNMQGVVPNNEAVVSLALSDYGTASSMIMVIGMIMNIVLARFSRLHYIFLTGHHSLYMACMLAVVLSIGGLSGIQLYITGGLLLAFISAVSPAYCQVTFRKVTGTDSIALGHFGGIGYWLAGQVGKLFAKDEKSVSTEELNFPQRLIFLRDTTVSIAITMIILFLIVTGVAVGRGILSEDPTQFDYLDELLNVDTETQSNWVVWSITSGVAFSGGVYIILSGVRLIVGEIVPAFKGIAEKLVPGATPAIDCPVAYPYAPTAVIIGFLTSFVAGCVGLGILILVDLYITPCALILPGVVPHFFCGATAGVFGNAEGGWKGCVAGAFVHGLLITFLPAICMPVFTQLGFDTCTFSDADFSWMGILFGNLAQVVPATGLLVISIVVYCIPIVYNYVGPKPKTEAAAE